jgi:hypothetical protein
VATNGAWKVWLKPMKPNAAPQTLMVAGATVPHRCGLIKAL